MALLVKSSCFVLALSVCLLYTVWAECNQDCAYCTYRLQGQHAQINPLTCTLECEGKLPAAKSWDMCKELLQLSKPMISQEGDHVSLENDKEKDDQHLLAKKYGGFMKRYGGFMKKMDELYNVEPDDENGREILSKRYGGFMKKDIESGSLANTGDLLKDLLNSGDNNEIGHRIESSDSDPEIMKRYGGFMRGFKRSPVEEDGAKEMQKRYGGFMRRVGRPEWGQDFQKRYGGFMRRFNDAFFPSNEDGESYSKEVPDLEKRYGGFMGV
ncbi:proenkephalin b [Latimeria chalumnae]|uniref:Proenkephalin n=1 Tax=Latimeria chalumnae TaxID=7897 RepID=H2ZS26_LATCH|nr:PREDICTED: proenkephalin-A [Latimeria chalumnae]|eukprot:XP_006013132.1 PREDICTED: proenkephalin-A [Latimeria chalumnae]